MTDPRHPNNPGSSPFTSPTTPLPPTASSGEMHTPHEESKAKAKQTAHDAKEAAQEQATSLLNAQKSMIAEQTGKLATAFQKMASQLDEQDQHYLSGFANNLARSTDVLSERLRDKDINTLLTQAQGYSRRQPAIFMAGAIATGFLLARFMRSSADHHHDQEGKTQPTSSDTSF